MNITLIDQEEQHHFTGISELAVEVDSALELSITDKMNRETFNDHRIIAVCKGAKIALIENDKPAAPKEKKVLPPFILVRLDTFQEKSFFTEEDARLSFSAFSYNNIPVHLYYFNENRKCYTIIKVANVPPSQ